MGDYIYFISDLYNIGVISVAEQFSYQKETGKPRTCYIPLLHPLNKMSLNAETF